MTQQGMTEVVSFRQGPTAEENLDTTSPLSRSWWTDWGRQADSNNIKLTISVNCSVRSPPSFRFRDISTIVRGSPINWLPPGAPHPRQAPVCIRSMGVCLPNISQTWDHTIWAILCLASFPRHSALGVNACDNRCRGLPPLSWVNIPQCVDRPIVKGRGEFARPPQRACTQKDCQGPSLLTHHPPRQEVIA